MTEAEKRVLKCVSIAALGGQCDAKGANVQDPKLQIAGGGGSLHPLLTAHTIADDVGYLPTRPMATLVHLLLNVLRLNSGMHSLNIRRGNTKAAARDSPTLLASMFIN